MDAVKLTSGVKEGLLARGAGSVTLFEHSHFVAALGGLAQRSVRVDRGSTSEWLIEELRARGARVELGADPCMLAKACKNASELAAIRAAHVRDAVAVVRFLAWFDEVAPGGHDEWTLAQKLAEFRAAGENYRGPSFHTISAFGPSAALPHYRASKESARPIGSDNLYLVDSGGQYLDGTTDITRVTVVGTPSAEMRRRYTQVLKGHIALASAQFPAGTTGSQLDPFARQFLWRDGVDFDHGTGHGVGCYLSVHEGPHGISKRPSDVALRPGMIVSNEPGYYKPGAYGIRIENLIAVVEVSPQPCDAERQTLGFSTLTLVPYERRLIDVGLLTPEERAHVDDYHARVREVLSARVDAAAARFLRAATEPLRD
jgi:Xaa-Pro aminopeptidase